MFPIARNKRSDRLRSERRPAFDPADPALVPDPEPAPDSGVDAAQAEARMRAAPAGLPPDQMRLLQLAFFVELSHRDIAARENLPPGPVESRIPLAIVSMTVRLAYRKPDEYVKKVSVSVTLRG